MRPPLTRGSGPAPSRCGQNLLRGWLGKLIILAGEHTHARRTRARARALSLTHTHTQTHTRTGSWTRSKSARPPAYPPPPPPHSPRPPTTTTSPPPGRLALSLPLFLAHSLAPSPAPSLPRSLAPSLLLSHSFSLPLSLSPSNPLVFLASVLPPLLPHFPHLLPRLAHPDVSAPGGESGSRDPRGRGPGR